MFPNGGADLVHYVTHKVISPLLWYPPPLCEAHSLLFLSGQPGNVGEDASNGSGVFARE